MSDWSDEETDDPLHADRRDFYEGRSGARTVSPGMPVYRFTALHLTDEALRFGYMSAMGPNKLGAQK